MPAEFVKLTHVLGDKPNAHRDARLAPTRVEGLLPRQHPQQRRLPGAVDTDETDPLPWRQVPGHPVKEGARPESEAGAIKVDDVLAEPGRREAQQFDTVAGRWLIIDEGVRRLDPELRLARPGRRPATQPGQLLAQKVVSSLRNDLGNAFPLRAGQDVRGIPALVGLNPTIDDLPGRAHDRVQEPPIVGDDEEGPVRARPRSGHVVGQPGNAFDVEVVGGLIEDEEVGVGNERPGERDAPPLPSGESPDRGIETADRGTLVIAEEPGDDLPDCGLAGPLVLGGVSDDDVTHGRRGVELVILGDPSQPQFTRMGASSRVQGAAAGEDIEQGGFPAAVAANDADRFAGADAERDGVEKHPSSGTDRRAFEVDEIGHQGVGAKTSIWAPVTGPRARRTSGATPEAVSATARSMADSRSRARKATVGPDPDTTPPSAPKARPASSTSARRGWREIAAASRSFVSCAATACESPLRRALSSAIPGWGSGTGAAPRRRSHSAYTAAVDKPVSASAKTQW